MQLEMRLPDSPSTRQVFNKGHPKMLSHDWSTNPPLTYPPRNKGLIRINKALLRETNGYKPLVRPYF